jgi:hypothetical protein
MANRKTLTPLQSAMAGTTFLRELAPPAIVRLSALGTVRHYRNRTYLCHQGEPAPDVFFLVDGRIEVSSAISLGVRASWRSPTARSGSRRARRSSIS